jgi:hypothetical protein
MAEQRLETFNRIAAGNIQKRRDLSRTLFVHIGTHKTGTTSIQNFLRHHATRLNECGIFVPASGTLNEESGHHNIAWEMRQDRRYDRRLGGVDELIRELKTCAQNTAVISSEDFEYLVQYPSELKAFDKRIEDAGFSTNYIVYFRERDSYARSLYCELEVSRLVGNFDELKRSIEKLGFVRVDGDLYYEFRYDLFIQNWEKILGPKIRAYSYDDAVQGTGLLPSFLSTIGASQPLIDASQIAPVVNTMFDKFQHVALQLAAVSEQLAAIQNSKSWRITAPLRGIVSFFVRFSQSRAAKTISAAEADHGSVAEGWLKPPNQANDDAPYQPQIRISPADVRRKTQAG